MVSKGLDAGFFGSWITVGFQGFWILVFRGLDYFGFFWIGSRSLLIQRCIKQGPGRNLFDREIVLPDERKICPTRSYDLSFSLGFQHPGDIAVGQIPPIYDDSIYFLGIADIQ